MSQPIPLLARAWVRLFSSPFPASDGGGGLKDYRDTMSRTGVLRISQSHRRDDKRGHNRGTARRGAGED